MAISTPIAVTSDIGIAVRLMMASRPDRRNATSTTTTRIDPIAIARATLRTDVSTNEAWREIGGSRRAPAGSVACRSCNARSTPRVTVRVSAHGNLLICTYTAGRPS